MCLNPKYAKFSQIYKPNGKRDIFFVPEGKRFENDTLVIPCGKCDECKLDYAREWSVRCQAEASLYEDNWFITLTYDSEHLPEAHPVILITDDLKEQAVQMAEESEDFVLPQEYYKGFLDCAQKDSTCLYLNTLVPHHFTQFIKSLRQYYKRSFDIDNIRFFGCGEYGSQTLRPHYHIILFNCPIFDLVPYKKNNGNQLFVSKTLSHIWDKGYVVIGRVTPESCGYVARYNYKKQVKGTSLYGVENEFIRMSRRPGIGYKYFEQNYEKLVETQFSVCFSGREYRNVHYFSRLACGFDLDSLRYIRSLTEVKNALRDRSLDDYHLIHNRSSKDVKSKLLKKDNISLDNGSVLLYNNRVKTKR